MNNHTKTEKQYYILIPLCIILLLLNCFREDVKAPLLPPALHNAPLPENIKTPEEIKQRVIQILTESAATRKIFADPEKEYLQRASWTEIQLVKNTKPRAPGDTLEYYYVVYAGLPDESGVGLMCINAITGENMSGGLLPFEDGERHYLLSKTEAARYVAEKLQLAETAEYEVRAVFFFQPPYNYNPGRHWKYEVRFKKHVPARAGRGDTFFVDPYVVGPLKETPTPQNTPLSRFLPHRLFILKEGKGGPGLVGID